MMISKLRYKAITGNVIQLNKAVTAVGRMQLNMDLFQLKVQVPC